MYHELRMRPKAVLVTEVKLSLCRRLEAEVECLDEPGREICLCNSNLCNMFLPALRETEPELQYWHALMLLVPVLLVLLALGAFWALRHARSGSFTVDPNYWKQRDGDFTAPPHLQHARGRG